MENDFSWDSVNTNESLEARIGSVLRWSPPSPTGVEGGGGEGGEGGEGGGGGVVSPTEGVHQDDNV